MIKYEFDEVHSKIGKINANKCQEDGKEEEQKGAEQEE